MSLIESATVTMIRRRPLPDPATPSPGATGGRVSFPALWDEIFAECERHRIWRDQLRKEGQDAHADDRQRLVDLYEANLRLIERCRDDVVIMGRLRALAAEAAAIAAAVKSEAEPESDTEAET